MMVREMSITVEGLLKAYFSQGAPVMLSNQKITYIYSFLYILHLFIYFNFFMYSLFIPFNVQNDTFLTNIN